MTLKNKFELRRWAWKNTSCKKLSKQLSGEVMEMILTTTVKDSGFKVAHG